MKMNSSKNTALVFVVTACAGIMVQACAKSRAGFHGQNLNSPPAGESAVSEVGNVIAPLSLHSIQPGLLGEYQVESRTCVSAAGGLKLNLGIEGATESLSIKDTQIIDTVKLPNDCTLKSVRNIVAADATGEIEFRNPLGTHDAILKNDIELAETDTSCAQFSNEALFPFAAKAKYEVGEASVSLLMDETRCASANGGEGKMKLILKKQELTAVVSPASSPLPSASAQPSPLVSATP